MFRSIRTTTVLALLLAACGGDDDARTTEQTRADQPAAPESPAFALVRGQDTLLIEQFTIDGNRVTGTMRDPVGSAVEYDATFGANGAESSMRVTMRAVEPEAPPIVWAFTIRGDSVFAETTRADSTVRSGDTIARGALPYMSPSMGLLSMIARSARTTVGDSGQITLLAASVSQPPMAVTPQIYWRADTAWIINDELNQFRLTFSNDRLVSAEMPRMQMRSVRVTAPALARPSAPATGTPSSSAPAE